MNETLRSVAVLKLYKRLSAKEKLGEKVHGPADTARTFHPWLSVVNHCSSELLIVAESFLATSALMLSIIYRGICCSPNRR